MNQKRKWYQKFLCTILVITNLTSITFSSLHVRAEEKQTQTKIDINSYRQNEVIVQYKQAPSQNLKSYAIKEKEVKGYQETFLSDTYSVIETDNTSDFVELISELEQDNTIASIQPNYIYHTMDITTTDPYFDKQWGLYNDGTFETPKEEQVTMPELPRFDRGSFWKPQNNWRAAQSITAKAGVDMKVKEAWEQFSSGGKETIIAIIDTGIDISHEDLSSVIWTNLSEINGDGIDNDRNGYIDDKNGWNFYDNINQVYKDSEEDEHGTHVAGIIGAVRNQIGIAGVSSNANIKIMPIKALGGKDGSGTTASIISAIEYAQNNGAVICNLSMGTESDDSALREAIKDSSMLFITASGNDGIDIDKTPIYPAAYSYDNIITVANLQCDGTLHESSNYGSTSVDVAAPGSSIYSTVPNNQYEYMTGTSMAAPMVTGVAAMIYSYYGGIDILTVKNILLTGVTPISDLSTKLVSGGIVNAYQSLNQEIIAASVSDLEEEVESIVLKTSKKVLKVGKTFHLTYSVLPKTAVSTVTYKSSNKKVATVNQKGKIKAKKAGKTTITVTAQNGITAKCIVRVKKK